MNILNLPTDNLYKFIALAGVVILVACFITLNLITNELKDESAIIITEQGELKFEIAYLEERRSKIESESERLDSLIERYNISNINQSKIDIKNLRNRLYNPEEREYFQFIFNNIEYIIPEYKLLGELKDKIQPLSDITHDIALKGHLLSRKIELFQLKQKQIKSSYTKLVIGICIGFLMMIFGFYF